MKGIDEAGIHREGIRREPAPGGRLPVPAVEAGLAAVFVRIDHYVLPLDIQP